MEHKRDWSELPFNLWLYVIEFVQDPCYKFVDWIDVNKLYVESISQHPRCIDFLLANPSKVSMANLCLNPNPKTQIILWNRPLEISWDNLITNVGTWIGNFICNFEHTICEPQPRKIIQEYPDDQKLIIFLPETIGGEIQKTTSKSHIEVISGMEDHFLSSPQMTKFLVDHVKDIDPSWISVKSSSVAIEYLILHPEKIDWSMLSGNPLPVAVGYLIKHPEKIDWMMFSRNRSPLAIEYLIKHPEKINWYCVPNKSYHHFVNLLDNDLGKVGWHNFNKIYNSPGIIEFLERHKDYISHMTNFRTLSIVPHAIAIEMLEQNIDKIDWQNLSINVCPRAIELLKLYPDNIDWYELSRNRSPQAIELLALHPDKVIWKALYNTDDPYGKFDLSSIINEKNAKLINYDKLYITYSLFERDVKATTHQYTRYLLSFNIRKI